MVNFVNLFSIWLEIWNFIFKLMYLLYLNFIDITTPPLLILQYINFLCTSYSYSWRTIFDNIKMYITIVVTIEVYLLRWTYKCIFNLFVCEVNWSRKKDNFPSENWSLTILGIFFITYIILFYSRASNTCLYFINVELKSVNSECNKWIFG